MRFLLIISYRFRIRQEESKLLHRNLRGVGEENKSSRFRRVQKSQEKHEACFVPPEVHSFRETQVPRGKPKRHKNQKRRQSLQPRIHGKSRKILLFQVFLAIF